MTRKTLFGNFNIHIFPVLLSIFFLFGGSELNKQKSKTSLLSNGYDDFRKKSYFEKIFDKTEVKTLDEIRKNEIKAQKKLSSADKFFEKADNYKKIVELSPVESDRQSALKKAQKFENKGARKALTQLDPMYKGGLGKYSIYRKRLQGMSNDGSPEHIFAKQLSAEAEKLFETSRDLYQKSASEAEYSKYQGFKNAISAQNEAFEKMETAFGYFMHDDQYKIEKKDIVKKDTLVSEIVKDTIVTELGKDNPIVITEIEENTKKDTLAAQVDEENKIFRYNPDNDSNVYHSKMEELIPKMDLPQADKDAVTKMKALVSRADIMLKNAEMQYIIIDSLNEKAAGEPVRKIKEQIKQQAVTLEKDVFDSLLTSVNMYIEANELLYGVYTKNISMHRPAGDKKGKEYEISAEDFYMQAQSLKTDAGLESYRHLQYISLMSANQMLLNSLQQIENAYCVYFSMPVTPIKIKNEFVKNDVKTSGNNNTGQQGKDENTNKKTENKTFVYLGTYVYTVENPAPEKIVHKKGVVFKLQIGVFKDLVSTKKYPEFSPYSFDTYKDTDLKRFAVGEYLSEEAAEAALKRIKQKGFRDAYIVSYVDGVRNTYKYGKSLIKKDENYQIIADNEMSRFKDLPVSYVDDNTLNKKENKKHSFSYGTGLYDFALGKDITKEKGLIYTVQIGLYQLPRTNEQIKQLQPVYTETSQEGTKYLIGVHQNYESAQKEKERIAKLGMSEAFVSSYLDGKPISLSKASKLHKKTDVVQTEEIYFQVQIGAYASKLPAEKEKEYQALAKKHIVTSKTDDNGLVIYTVGKTKTYSEALQLKNTLKTEGFKDGFVVAFKNGRKISVLEAVEQMNTKK